MSRVSARVGVFAMLGAVLLATLHCSDKTLALFQPEVTSATDNFQFQATGVKDRTTTLSYKWQVTGQQAKVNHSTTTSFGAARLVILDAAGSTVYDRTLAPSLSETTSVGGPGTWTIRLILTSYSGTINFRVQKV